MPWMDRSSRLGVGYRTGYPSVRGPGSRLRYRLPVKLQQLNFEADQSYIPWNVLVVGLVAKLEIDGHELVTGSGTQVTSSATFPSILYYGRFHH
jgi:hypothetical protein